MTARKGLTENVDEVFDNDDKIDYHLVAFAHAQKASPRVYLHTPEMLKMWNFGTVIQFPYEIRHKLVERFGAKTNLIVVYG